MLKKFKFFDVTLRDGLQSISKIYTLNEKKDIFHNILKKILLLLKLALLYLIKFYLKWKIQ